MFSQGGAQTELSDFIIFNKELENEKVRLADPANAGFVLVTIRTIGCSNREALTLLSNVARNLTKVTMKKYGKGHKEVLIQGNAAAPECPILCA